MFKSEKQGQKIYLQEWVKALSSFKINMHYFTLNVNRVNEAGKTQKKEQRRYLHCKFFAVMLLDTGIKV